MAPELASLYRCQEQQERCSRSVESCKAPQPALPEQYSFLAGLSMRLLESKKGLSFFAFEHSEEYQQAQHKFLVAVESMEPNNIVVCNPVAPDGGSGHVLCLVRVWS